MTKLILILCLFFTFMAHADDGLKNESELSTSIVSGNSNSETYGFKQLSVYVTGKNTLKGSGRYVSGRTNGVESARAWDAALRYELGLSDQWSAFVGHTVESDVYAGYVQRNSTDIGAKYFLLKDEKTNWFAEAGYRYSQTNYVSLRPGTEEYAHSGRLYTEANHTLNESVSGKLWVEYLPNFTNPDGYLINAEPSVTAIMSSMFSLKTSYLMKYQNPNKANVGAKSYLDTTFMTSLVAKF